jgi:uncharacterized membrane protein YgdD (TMEM256/DUF423 family)
MSAVPAELRAARASRVILAIGALVMALATIFGALGAHALPGRLAPGQLQIYDVAVRFQFFQALGLMVLGAVARAGYPDSLHAAVILLIAGIITFCGSLYLIAFQITLSLVVLATPLGGILLISGWLMFAVTSWRARRAG